MSILKYAINNDPIIELTRNCIIRFDFQYLKEYELFTNNTWEFLATDIIEAYEEKVNRQETYYLIMFYVDNDLVKRCVVKARNERMYIAEIENSL